MATAATAQFDLLPVDTLDQLGEGPWWSVEEQRLLWVDILGRAIRSSDLDGADAKSWHVPQDVGFALPAQDGTLLTGQRDGLFWFDRDSGDLELACPVESDLAGNRINDGKTDRAGRVWFGTMHDAQTEAAASLYCVDSGGLSRRASSITTSNGLGWSPDNRVMYYTDSLARCIFSYEFDLASGELGARTVFARDPAGYVPDGLTVDSEGFVWAAKWDGGRVVRYAPDGRVDRELLLRVSRPTSCMFVGSSLDTLAVTSAQPASGRHGDEPLAGSVFLLDPRVTGLAEQPVAHTKTFTTTKEF